MKTHQLRSLATIGVLWLALGAGCRKDPPEPSCEETGNCCEPGSKLKFVIQLSGVLARYGTISFRFKEPFKGVDGESVHGLTICSAQWDELAPMNLKATPYIATDSTNIYPDVYPYKVWGTIYQDLALSGHGVGPGNSYHIRLERVEANN